MTPEPEAGGFRRLLVATDFSSGSEQAWVVARQLAGRLGAEIVLIHVLVEAPLFAEGPFTMKHTREVFEAARAWVEKMPGGVGGHGGRLRASGALDRLHGRAP